MDNEPSFIDSQDMTWALHHMTPEHWHQMLEEIRGLSPENIELQLRMLQSRLGLSDTQIEQCRAAFGTIKQLDPQVEDTLVEQIGHMPPEQLEAAGQLSALFYNAGQTPAFPAIPSRGIPDISSMLLIQEMSRLTTLQQEYVRDLLNKSALLTQQKEWRKLIDIYDHTLAEFAGVNIPYLKAVFFIGRAQSTLGLLDSNPQKFAEVGLADCSAALAFLTREQTPAQWATAILLRSMFYVNRPAGTREDNLERALSDLNTIVDTFSYETLPGIWVMASGTRGLVLQELDKKNGRGHWHNIDRAIADLEAGLAHLSYEETPEPWALFKAVCTQAYLFRYKYSGDRTRTLEQIIQDCNDSLKVATRERHPQQWALLLLTRSLAYTERSGGDPQENREQAISDSQQALTIFTRARDPYEWACAQINLGTVYLFHPGGNRAENLKEAIKYSTNALQVFTSDAYPNEWAKATSNRTIAMQELDTGDRNALKEQNLTNFEEALAHLDPEEHAIDWATIHVNWGNSYLNRLQGDRTANMEQALLHFNLALTVFTADQRPQLWARTLINRAMAKRSLVPPDLLRSVRSEEGPFMTMFSQPLNKTMDELSAYVRH